MYSVCYVMTTCNLRLAWIPDTGRTRTRQVLFFLFCVCLGLCDGRYELRVNGSERGKRERWDQTQGGGTSKDQGRRNLALSHPLPGFHFVLSSRRVRDTHTRVGSQPRESLLGGIERSARFRSALAFVYNDLTSLCEIVPQAIFLPFRFL